MSYLDHIHACNRGDARRYLPFEIDGQTIGALRPEFATALIAHSDDFHCDDQGRYGFAPHVTGPDARSRALGMACETLQQNGIIRRLHGEKFDIRPRLAAPSLAVLDRAAMPYFGLRSWGVHMNGFVRKSDGIHMWIAHRAKDKPTYPGMLDNMVAGGQPAGLGFFDNMVKECGEEADIPADLARQCRPVGTVSYLHETDEGLKPDVMVNYDLELPADFTPFCRDGEVERFELLPLAEVAAIVRDSFDFKFNCALVIIDFLIRHGFLNADTEADYSELAAGLQNDIFRPRPPQ